MPSSYAESTKKGIGTKSEHKLFLSFAPLADRDVTFQVGDETYEFPKRDIRISERFWRADGCYRTGKCCSKVSMYLFISDNEYRKLKELYPTGLATWSPLSLKVSTSEGVLDTTLWTSIGGNKCPYLENDNSTNGWKGGGIAGCAIHELNPIHCALPHLYFDIKNTKKPLDQQYINVTKRQFGRNWAFGCPVEFIAYNEFARKRDLLLLNRVKDLLIEFTGTAERVSDIISRVEERPLLSDVIPLTLKE